MIKLLAPLEDHKTLVTLTQTNETLRKQLAEKEQQVAFILEKDGIQKSSIPSAAEEEAQSKAAQDQVDPK